MSNIIQRLTTTTNQAIRLTHSIDDVAPTLKIVNVIIGKVVDEAIEYNYYPNKSKAYEGIAKISEFSASALESSHKAYTNELTLRFEIAKKKDTKFRDSQNEKLSSLSEGAKRELGKGITTNGGKPSPKGITIAMVLLEALPTKATAKDIKSIRGNINTRAFSMTIRSRVYAEAKGICAECEQFANWDYYECDHVIPYSKGGATNLANAQCLCKACNRTKGNRDE